MSNRIINAGGIMYYVKGTQLISSVDVKLKNISILSSNCSRSRSGKCCIFLCIWIIKTICRRTNECCYYGRLFRVRKTRHSLVSLQILEDGTRVFKKLFARRHYCSYTNNLCWYIWLSVKCLSGCNNWIRKAINISDL